jgi:hypothetical protein
MLVCFELIFASLFRVEEVEQISSRSFCVALAFWYKLKNVGSLLSLKETLSFLSLVRKERVTSGEHVSVRAPFFGY